MTWRSNQPSLKHYHTRSWMNNQRSSLWVFTPKQAILTAKAAWSTSDLESTGNWVFPSSIAPSIWCKILHFNRVTQLSRELCISTNKQVIMCHMPNQQSHQKIYSCWEKKVLHNGSDTLIHCREKYGLISCITWEREHKRESTSTRRTHLVLAKQQLARSMSFRNTSGVKVLPR